MGYGPAQALNLKLLLCHIPSWPVTLELCGTLLTQILRSGASLHTFRLCEEEHHIRNVLQQTAAMSRGTWRRMVAVRGSRPSLLGITAPPVTETPTQHLSARVGTQHTRPSQVSWGLP